MWAKATIGEAENETAGLPIQTLDVRFLDPGHQILLEPAPIRRKILHRAWLERLQSARPIVIGKAVARRRCRYVGPEAVRFQVALATSLGDRRPEPHRLSEDAVLDLASRKMSRQRQAIGPSSDDCD
jgi:hypothetical protein